MFTRLTGIRLWGLAALACASAVLADPAPASRCCEVTSAPEAKALADRLFEKEQYQEAGACYEVAGDMARANLAFLKAAGPKSQESAKALKAQAEQAKDLLVSVQRAFHSNH